MFVVRGTDTSGSVELKRETLLAALKKARELSEDGCWDVRITAPDGRVYLSTEFDSMAT